MDSDGNPYEDNSEASTEQDDLAEMRRQMDEENETEKLENTLTVGDPVHEEEDEGGPPTLRGKAKKRDRANKFREKREADMQALHDERAEMKTQLDEMRGQIASMAQRPQQQQAPRANPFDTEAAQQDAAQKATLNEYQRSVDTHARANTQMPDEEQETFLARNRQHARDVAGLESRRTMAAQNTPQQQVEARLMAQHPDVMGVDKARSYAVAAYKMKELSGQIKNAADAAKAEADSMDEARKAFRLGPVGNPPASERQQASYGRMGRGGSGTAPKGSKTHVITDYQKEMALAAYDKRDDLSDGQKYQMWVNKHAD